MTSEMSCYIEINSRDVRFFFPFIFFVHFLAVVDALRKMASHDVQFDECYWKKV